MGNSKIFGFWAKKCPYRGSTPCGRAQGCMPPNMGRRGFGVPQNISFDHNSRFGIFLAINRYWLNSWAHSLSIGTGKRKSYRAKKKCPDRRTDGQTDRRTRKPPFSVRLTPKITPPQSLFNCAFRGLKSKPSTRMYRKAHFGPWRCIETIGGV